MTKSVASAIADVGQLYGGLLRIHGPDPKAAGYKDAVSQRLRYAKLAQLIEPGSADISVNELGCGYGAFLRYLDQRSTARTSRYFGYDVSPEMLAAAAAFLDDPRATLIESARVTEDADYTFLSGIFNVKLDVPAGAWADHVKDTLARSFARSRKGLAFYCLTTHVDWMESKFFYADPLEFFEFCRTALSKHVTLLHDYPLWEWTMLIRR